MLRKSMDSMKEGMAFDTDKKAKMNALMSLVKEMDSLLGGQLKGAKEVKVEVEPSDEEKIDMSIKDSSIENKVLEDEESCNSMVGDKPEKSLFDEIVGKEPEDDDSIFSKLKKCR